MTDPKETPPSFTPSADRKRPTSDKGPSPESPAAKDPQAPQPEVPQTPPPPSFTPTHHRPQAKPAPPSPTSPPSPVPPPVEPTLVAAPMPAAISPRRRSTQVTAQELASRPAPPAQHPPARTPFSDAPPPHYPEPAAARPPRRRRRPRRLFRRALVLVLIALIAWPTWLLWYTNSHMNRVEATSTSPDTRGTTYLFAGSDSREGWNPDDPTAGQRSDSTILVHRAPNGQASMVSLPRDSYLNIPGYGMNKLNAAFALGGPTLLIDTVEEATGLHVDHYVEIGMAGVTNTVDALGSVNLCWDADVSDEFSGMEWTAGCHRVDGTAALAFSRMRYADPTGDVGRQQRQRQVMNAVVSETLSPGVLLNPVKQFHVAKAASEALTVGEHTNVLNVATLMLAMRKATNNGMVGVPPIESVNAMNEVGSVMLWDEGAAVGFFQKMKTGNLTTADFVVPQ